MAEDDEGRFADGGPSGRIAEAVMAIKLRKALDALAQPVAFTPAAPGSEAARNLEGGPRIVYALRHSSAALMRLHLGEKEAKNRTTEIKNLVQQFAWLDNKPSPSSPTKSPRRPSPSSPTKSPTPSPTPTHASATFAAPAPAPSPVPPPAATAASQADAVLVVASSLPPCAVLELRNALMPEALVNFFYELYDGSHSTAESPPSGTLPLPSSGSGGGGGGGGGGADSGGSGGGRRDSLHATTTGSGVSGELQVFPSVVGSGSSAPPSAPGGNGGTPPSATTGLYQETQPPVGTCSSVESSLSGTPQFPSIGGANSGGGSNTHSTPSSGGGGGSGADSGGGRRDSVHAITTGSGISGEPQVFPSVVGSGSSAPPSAPGGNGGTPPSATAGPRQETRPPVGSVPTPERAPRHVAEGASHGTGSGAEGSAPSPQSSAAPPNESCYVLCEVTTNPTYLLHKLLQLEVHARALAMRPLRLSHEGAVGAPPGDLAGVVTLLVVACKGLESSLSSGSPSSRVSDKVRSFVLENLPFVAHMWRAGRLLWADLAPDECQGNGAVAELLLAGDVMRHRMDSLDSRMGRLEGRMGSLEEEVRKILRVVIEINERGAK
jgi:hypothetical protein